MARFGLARLIGGKASPLVSVDSHFHGIVIGRSKSADVTVDSAKVSRRHARIWLQGKRLFIEDLGSRNGIRVNGKRVVRSGIQNGDEIGIGDAEFRIIADDVAPASPDDQVLMQDRIPGGDGTATPSDLQANGEGHQNGAHQPKTLHPAVAAVLEQCRTITDNDKLLNAILRTAMAFVKSRRGYILARKPGGEGTSVTAFMAFSGAAAMPSLDRTLVSQVMATRRPALRMDPGGAVIPDDERSERHPNLGLICVPIVAEPECIGALYLDAPDGDVIFEEEHVRIASALAKYIAVVMTRGFAHFRSVAQSAQSAQPIAAGVDAARAAFSSFRLDR